MGLAGWVFAADSYRVGAYCGFVLVLYPWVGCMFQQMQGEGFILLLKMHSQILRFYGASRLIELNVSNNPFVFFDLPRTL